LPSYSRTSRQTRLVGLAQQAYLSENARTIIAALPSVPARSQTQFKETCILMNDLLAHFVEALQ